MGLHTDRTMPCPYRVDWGTVAYSQYRLLIQSQQSDFAPTGHERRPRRANVVDSLRRC
jgi:hypothetical protein